MKLVANMVGHNEADRYLDEVLNHLKKIVDVIVFTDDCSTDDTPEIAQKHGAQVYHMEEPTFTKNEGLLRSTAWSNLTQHVEPGDWILAIDCDEKLWAGDPKFNIYDLFNQNDFDVINVKFFHMWNETQYRVDKLWRPNNSTRLFKFFYGGQFHDRRLACGSEPTYVQTLLRRGRYMSESGLAMQHLGYMRDEDKQAKYDRYMTLDGGDFHQRAHIESIVDENPTLVDWAHD